MMTKIVRLLEDRPFLFHGNPGFYHKGDIFEVLGEKALPLMGLGYKIKDLKFDVILDGWNAAKDFEGV